MVSHLKTFLINGVKSSREFFLFLGEFWKDQEVIQQGSEGYITRIRRLYNKGQEVIQQSSRGFLAGFFWYQCYYLHQSRNALSPICWIFVSAFRYHFVKNPNIKNNKCDICLWDCVEMNLLPLEKKSSLTIRFNHVLLGWLFKF